MGEDEGASRRDVRGPPRARPIVLPTEEGGGASGRGAKALREARPTSASIVEEERDANVRGARDLLKVAQIPASLMGEDEGASRKVAIGVRMASSIIVPPTEENIGTRVPPEAGAIILRRFQSRAGVPGAGFRRVYKGR